MLTSLTYTLFIALLLLPLNLFRTDSQNNPEVKSPGKPARVKSAKTELLPAPKKLSEHGIEFYDYRIDLPVKIVINLYDQSRSMVATAELSEDTTEKSYLYKIRPAGGEESWVRVAAQTSDAGPLYSLTSSEGGAVKVQFEKRAENDPEPITCRLPCEDFSEYSKPAEEDENEGFETILP